MADFRVISSKFLLISILFIFLFLTSYETISALSPGSLVMECGENIKAHGNCDQILCEWDNVSANWPSETGYRKDCSEYKYNIFNFDNFAFLSILLIAILITIFFTHLNKKRIKVYFSILMMFIILFTLFNIYPALFYGESVMIPYSFYLQFLPFNKGN